MNVIPLDVKIIKTTHYKMFRRAEKLMYFCIFQTFYFAFSNFVLFTFVSNLFSILFVFVSLHEQNVAQAGGAHVLAIGVLQFCV